MADNAGNTAVPKHGDHDRVTMLSLKADGTPDQNNPEIIGDKEFAVGATRTQFTQQAVSAVDQQQRGIAATNGEPVEQDPGIAEMQQTQAKVAEQAEKAADKAVESLFTTDEKLTASGKGGADPKPTIPAKKTAAAGQ